MTVELFGASLNPVPEGSASLTSCHPSPDSEASPAGLLLSPDLSHLLMPWRGIEQRFSETQLMKTHSACGVGTPSLVQ